VYASRATQVQRSSSAATQHFAKMKISRVPLLMLLVCVWAVSAQNFGRFFLRSSSHGGSSRHVEQFRHRGSFRSGNNHRFFSHTSPFHNNHFNDVVVQSPQAKPSNSNPFFSQTNPFHNQHFNHVGLLSSQSRPGNSDPFVSHKSPFSKTRFGAVPQAVHVVSNGAVPSTQSRPGHSDSFVSHKSPFSKTRFGTVTAAHHVVSNGAVPSTQSRPENSDSFVSQKSPFRNSRHFDAVPVFGAPVPENRKEQ